MVGPLTSDDGSIEGTALKALQRYFLPLSRRRDDPYDTEAAAATALVPPHADVLTAAGFTGVVALQHRWWSTPAGREADDVGEDETRLARLYQGEMEAAQLLEAQCQEIRTYRGWSPERANQLLSVVRAEIRDPCIRAYFPA